jgi:hypothetical protein
MYQNLEVMVLRPRAFQGREMSLGWDGDTRHARGTVTGVKMATDE